VCVHAGRAKGGAFRFQQEEQASKPQLARSALPPAVVITPLKQPQVAQIRASVAARFCDSTLPAKRCL
jgi:hypothetical protein